MTASLCYTAHDLAQMLQLDETTIYRKADRHEIPSSRLGRTVRFPKPLINKWLEKEGFLVPA